MIEIINNLQPFFEDSYRRVGVREYARLIGVSPPTSSKLLKGFVKEGLLEKEDFRGLVLFHPVIGNRLFRDLCRIYWSSKLEDLVEYFDKEFVDSSIVLFGSLSKGEVRENSDIDLAIVKVSEKKVDLEKFEKKLKRKIQVFWFDSLKKGELMDNVVNGFVLKGRLRI